MKFVGSKYISLLFMTLILSSCSSSPLKYDKAAQLSKNDEFDKAVKIEHTEPALADDDDGDAAGSGPGAGTATTPGTTPATPAPTPTGTSSSNNEPAKPTSSGKSKKAKKPAKKIDTATVVATTPAVKATTKTKAKKAKKEAASATVTAASSTAATAAVTPTPAAAETATAPTATAKREPDLEDDVGFAGRRPVTDPFQVGEVVTHDVHYFKVSAGTMKLKVAPMVNVNGRKAYNFVTEVKSSSVFSSFYSVDDKVENFVDFETLVPRVFTLHVKETSQLREARMIFDEKTLKATYWEKKVTDKNGEEEKKQAWEILPYSQNVFSAAFYMRVFQWEPGKEISFRVADDEQNLVFKGKCLRRETLDTVLGPKKALVIKPEVTLKGAFKPMGDIYIWLSDDEHKYVLRIESKIKIGTIISEVIAIKPGRN